MVFFTVLTKQNQKNVHLYNYGYADLKRKHIPNLLQETRQTDFSCVSSLPIRTLISMLTFHQLTAKLDCKPLEEVIIIAHF